MRAEGPRHFGQCDDACLQPAGFCYPRYPVRWTGLLWSGPLALPFRTIKNSE